jgi:hypothetical protein
MVNPVQLTLHSNEQQHGRILSVSSGQNGMLLAETDASGVAL